MMVCEPYLFAQSLEYGVEFFEFAFLFGAIATFKGMSDAVVEVSGKHFCINSAQEGLGAQELVRDVNAVAIVFDHFEKSVNLAAGCF